MTEHEALARFHERLAEHRQAISGQDFIPSVEAADFIEQMEREEPEALEIAIRAKAQDYARLLLTRGERKGRSRMMARVKGGVFSEAVKGFEETGDSGLFAKYFVINSDGLRRQFGRMRGIDCRHQRIEYETQGRISLARAAFLAAIEKRAGRKLIKNVLTQREAEELLASFIGDHKPLFGPTA